MKASVLDLRRRMGRVLEALDRNEPVTLMCRGKKKAVIYPAGTGPKPVGSAKDQPACGMWKDRKDMANVLRYVRNLRRGRIHDL